MKSAALLLTAFAAAAALAEGVAVPPDERMKGAFLIASTPYLDDGSVDYDSLVAEAKFMDASGCRGIIWPQACLCIDLLSHEEKFEGWRRLADAARGFRNAVLVLGVSGTNAAETVELARQAERTVADAAKAGKGGLYALAARPPTLATSEAEVRECYDALGKVARRPVIIQTFVSRRCPVPTVELLVDLARRHPGVYGYIKEETIDETAEDRQVAEVAAKPVIRSVFSALGGWKWLYQFRQCHTEGLISERAAYAPLVACIWEQMRTGDPRGRLQEAFAMYRYMIDQRKIPGGSLRGYSIYYLKRLGLFRTTKSRTYRKSTGGGEYDWDPKDGFEWKVEDLQLSDAHRAELDANYDGMMRLVRDLR